MKQRVKDCETASEETWSSLKQFYPKNHDGSYVDSGVCEELAAGYQRAFELAKTDKASLMHKCLDTRTFLPACQEECSHTVKIGSVSLALPLSKLITRVVKYGGALRENLFQVSFPLVTPTTEVTRNYVPAKHSVTLTVIEDQYISDLWQRFKRLKLIGKLFAVPALLVAGALLAADIPAALFGRGVVTQWGVLLPVSMIRLLGNLLHSIITHLTTGENQITEENKSEVTELLTSVNTCLESPSTRVAEYNGAFVQSPDDAGCLVLAKAYAELHRRESGRWFGTGKIEKSRDCLKTVFHTSEQCTIYIDMKVYAFKVPTPAKLKVENTILAFLPNEMKAQLGKKGTIRNLGTRQDTNSKQPINLIRGFFLENEVIPLTNVIQFSKDFWKRPAGIALVELVPKKPEEPSATTGNVAESTSNIASMLLKMFG